MIVPPLTRKCDRTLSVEETDLLLRMLRISGSASFISQIPDLRVVAESTSTWPIIEFTHWDHYGKIVADFTWSSGNGVLGIHVFANRDVLACMECWSIGCVTSPTKWPLLSELQPLTG